MHKPSRPWQAGIWIMTFAGLHAIGPRPPCSRCLAVAEPITVAQPVNVAQPVTVQTVHDEEQLRSALRDLQPGTTLRIAPGIYRGGHAVRDTDGLTIEALDGQRPPEFRGGNVAWHFSNCSKLIVRRLRISGARDNGINIDDGGHLQRPAKDLLLDGLEISDIGPQGNHDGIKLSGIQRFVIKRCQLKGWAGQGIDMVGCHTGRIEECHFQGKQGFNPSAGVQTKGGSANITIDSCIFVDAGERPVNIGGSTGLAYFRPENSTSEAANITVSKCQFEGSPCAAAFVGVDGARFQNNVVRYPTKWIFRVLQESTDERFVPCRNILVEDNCIVFRRSEVTNECNVGPGTEPTSMVFLRNKWFAEDRPDASRPKLPVEEQDGHYGEVCDR